MSSAHINADPGAFADTVLLPGDPYRARHIATTLLEEAIAPELELGSIVVALGAGTDSRVNRIRFRDYDFPATASWPLLERVTHTARAHGQAVRVGNVFSSDLFYHPDTELRKSLARLGFLAIEMETAGLYGVAAELGVEALAVLTVSDQIDRSSSMSPEQRETGLDDMTRLVLDALAAD